MDQDSANNSPTSAQTGNQQSGAPSGSPKQQLVERLKSASNVLVTVRNNPTVDQLSACIGLTILLNKLDKHATAVFSGTVPSTLEFLKPEETLEKTTDSLRDFIIALDKSKADKLRYKVEDKVVKIFITPYKTSITQDDLDFSQGDFNVDAVVALGAHEQTDLDQAITSHGRILHDATVMSINNTQSGNLGSVKWEDTRASSLSELVAQLTKAFDKKVLDEQIATALLTGIVAETDRFSNEKTSPETMKISSELMSAGANQQLVAKQLEPADIPEDGSKQPADISHEPDNPPKSDDGTLEINHDGTLPPVQEPQPGQLNESVPDFELPDAGEPPTGVVAPDVVDSVLPPLPPPPELPHIRQLHDEPRLPNKPQSLADVTGDSDNRGFVSEPPSMGGQLTANTEQEELEGTGDPFSVQANNQQVPLLSRDDHTSEPPMPPTAPTPPEPQPVAPKQPEPPQPEPPKAPVPPAVEAAPETDDGDLPTLTDIERSVHSPHVDQAAEPLDNVDSARDEVLKALSEASEQAPEPIVALNAQPLGQDLHPGTPPTPLSGPMSDGMPQVHVDEEGNLHLPSVPPTELTHENAPSPLSPADQPLTMPLPPASSFSIPPPQETPPTNSPNPTSAGAPPPVPHP